MSSPKGITVVGACNVDLISYVPTLPKKGETIKGSTMKQGFGGKGANQAVQAAKLGAKTNMIGKLGKDNYGRDTLKNFEQYDVDTTHLFVADDESVPSGLAPIAVDSQGNNSIIIIGGANDLLTDEEIESCRQIIKNSAYLVCQLELLPSATLKAMKVAKEEGVRVLLNPAPGVKDLSKEFFEYCDIICPNETELEILSGKSVNNLEEAKDAAKVLLERGAEIVVVTLGAEGSLMVTKSETFHAPPVKAEKVVDTTGAGDSFIGSLVYFLSVGKDMKEAMKRANFISSMSVQKEGTQISYPWKKDLPSNLFD